MSKEFLKNFDIVRPGNSRITDSGYYKKLHKDYPTVKGYCNFSEVSYALAYKLFYLSKVFNSSPHPYFNVDFFGADYFELELGFYRDPAYSVWFLNDSVLEAIKNTVIKNDQIKDLNKVSPMGVIMLPSKVFKSVGDFCQYIVFYHNDTYLDKSNLTFCNKEICLTKIGSPYLRWAVYLNTGERVSSTLVLGQDSGSVVERLGERLDDRSDEHNFDSDSDDDIVYLPVKDVTITGGVKTNDKRVILSKTRKDTPNTKLFRDIESIVIQTLLYLQTRPEDITPVNPYSLAPVEPKQAKKGGKKRYTPLMIGKQFKPKTETVPLGGTHASPRTHWRRGHWRRVAIGEGRGERKWCWFQPVLVNG